MALFLETTYSSSAYEGNLTDVAFDGIALMQEEMQLMEAIYQADFIMHEQNKNLSESARVLKEGNFLGNVISKVIEWAKKIWAWLKNFFTKIKDKIVEIYNRIKDHLTDNTITISKSYIAKAEATIEFMNSAKSWVKVIGKSKTLEAVKAQGEKMKSMEKALADKKKAAEKQKGTSTISKTYFDKLAALPKEIGEDIESEVEDIIKDLEEEKSNLADTHKSISDGASSTEADKGVKDTQETIAIKRLIMPLLRATAITSGTVGVSIMSTATSAIKMSKDSPDKSFA